MLDQCILLLVVVAGYRKDFILNLFAARLNLRHKIRAQPWSWRHVGEGLR